MNNNEIEAYKQLFENNQKYIENQLKELSENSKKMSEYVHDMRIEITKLNGLINSDIDTLKDKVEKIESWKEIYTQIISPEDLRGLKTEVSNQKKFQIQTLTIGMVLMLFLQFFVFPSIKDSFQKPTNTETIRIQKK